MCGLLEGFPLGDQTGGMGDFDKITWHVAYDLSDDRERLDAMRVASRDRTRPDIGLSPKPYLVGSRRFWRALSRGRLARQIVEGVVTSVYWGSMGDYPMFEVEDHAGRRSTWAREGDPFRYAEGLNVRIEAVDMPRKGDLGSGSPNTLVLRILIEDSRLRSRGCGPGPFTADLATTLIVKAEPHCWPVWHERLMGNIDPRDLGISRQLAADLIAWAESCETDRAGASSEQTQLDRDAEGHRLAKQLRSERGPDLQVEYWRGSDPPSIERID
jgi:hypothetical protein